MGQIQLQLQRLDSEGAHLYEPDEQLQLLFGETKDELLPRMESIIDERGIPENAKSEYDEEIRSWMKHALHSKEYYERATFMGLAIEIVGGDWKSFPEMLCGEEFLYAAQMILDDIADGQTERHGQPTVNAAVGIDKGIAVSQMLACLGFNCVQRGSAGTDSETQNMVVEGAHSMMKEIFYAQYLDEALEEKPLSDTTREDYDHFLDHTTPVDIAYCFEAGGRLAGANDDQTGHLRRFGHRLGNIIQIRDDMIDYAENKIADKNTGLDIKAMKKRLPLVLYYNKGGNNMISRLDRLEEKEQLSRSHVKNIKKEVLNSSVIDRIRQIIDNHRLSAREELNEIGLRTEGREFLSRLLNILKV